MSDQIAHAPIERSSRVIAAEVAVTAAVAYLGGVCLAVAAGHEPAPAVQLVMVGLAIVLVFGYGAWLLGGSGVPLAAVSLPLLILSADVALVASGFLDLGAVGSVLGSGLGGVLPPLLATAASATTLLAGLLLPGPRRLRSAHLTRPRPRETAAQPRQVALQERLRSADVVPASSSSSRDDLWADDATEEDGLLPLAEEMRIELDAPPPHASSRDPIPPEHGRR